MPDERSIDVEYLFRVVLDNMPGALAYTDADLDIVFCNDRFKEMYRVPPELLEPGQPYAGLLRYLAEHGYYGDGDRNAMVARRVESLRNPTGASFEDHTPDGRWYRILRRRVTGGGTVTVPPPVTRRRRIRYQRPSGVWSSKVRPVGLRRLSTRWATSCSTFPGP